MKSITLLAALAATFQAHAAVEECGDDQAQQLNKQVDCVTKSLGRVDRAKKMLEQRLAVYQAKVDKIPKTSPKLTEMSTAAVDANKSLKQLKESSEKATSLKQEIADFTLNANAERKTMSDSTLSTLHKDAHDLAEKTEQSKKADQDLDQLIASLKDVPESATSAIKLAKLREIQFAANLASQKKQEVAEARSKLLQLARQSEIPAPAADAEGRLAIRAAKLYRANESVLKAANNAMTAMLATLDDAPPSTADNANVLNRQRLDFLNFLESHPLLESELSGTGIQISSTAGSGRITLKPEFLWGRRARYWVAASVSTSISKDSDDGMSAITNNAYLDKLADDTTIKGEFTHLNPSSNGKSFWLVGGSGEVGYQKYSYLDPQASFSDPTKPKQIEKNDTSYKYSLYAGFSPSDFNDLFILRYSRQYSHKEQPSVAICPPIASGAAYVMCPSGRLGAPEGRKYHTWTTEWRHRFEHFAVAPALTYDRTTKVRAFALPLYFSLINQSTGVFGSALPQLTAGLQYSWRSDTKGSLGVFAGVPFSMVKSD